MDYTTWSHEELVKRVTKLESELRAQNEQHTSLLPQATTTNPHTAPLPPKKKSKKPTPFDPSKYNTRRIALKFAYLGARYNGFEHHINNTTPLPTIEEELWKALVKTRLIFPRSVYGDGEEKEGTVGDWEGCGYSKCGRTDRGVSAFGQVIGITVRSARPVLKEAEAKIESDVVAAEGEPSSNSPEDSTKAPPEEVEQKAAPFDPIRDELPYIALLNRVLPSDIRILAWCPHPPDNFDARFSCKERRYRYFFTSPAFLPLPGSSGVSSRTGGHREGWLDVEAMREAASYLVGTHDFRNLCKVDPTKQLTSFTRRISYAGISSVSQAASPEFIARFAGGDEKTGSIPGPERMQLWSFDVQGSAFLWHQVRCMIGILFLVGQRLERPTLVKELLNIDNNPRKPHYEMASDQPLVLWDCMFSVDPDKGKFEVGEKPKGYVDRGVGQDELEWVYASEAGPGDTAQAKWGPMGLMPDLWRGWRKAKMDELLAAQLLDLVANQGNGEDGQIMPSPPAVKENQRVFEGHDDALPRGKYVPVMQRPKMDTVEVINARWATRKGKSPRVAADKQVGDD